MPPVMDSTVTSGLSRPLSIAAFSLLLSVFMPEGGGPLSPPPSPLPPPLQVPPPLNITVSVVVVACVHCQRGVSAAVAVAIAVVERARPQRGPPPPLQLSHAPVEGVAPRGEGVRVGGCAVFREHRWSQAKQEPVV